MRGIHEFVIEIGKAFNNTLKHGTLELYTDHRAKQQEQSNRRGTVISVPMKTETDVEPGAEVIIDPTVLFQQVYAGKMQESQFLVDKEKGWYRVVPDMVILYKNPGQTEFTGHKQNLFATPIKEEVSKIGSIYIPKPENQQESTAVIAIGNKELTDVEGITKGDTVYYKKNRSWKFSLDGEEFVFLRNFDLLGKKE